MDIISTKAIPLHTIKYSDSAIIARVFTRELGLIGTMVRGAASRKSVKRRLLQPFTLLEIQVVMKPGKDLGSMREMTVDTNTPSVHGSVLKGGLVMFITEILAKSLEEHYVNPELFHFVWDSIVALDHQEKIANYHIWFLVKLTSFYGFHPHPPERASDRYFDLVSGEFVSSYRNVECLNHTDSRLLFLFLGMKFDEAMKFELSKEDRKSLLQGLLDYFGFQISGLKEINSHLVLETVLND